MKKHTIFFLILISIILNLTSCSSAKKTFGSAQDNKSYDEQLRAFYAQVQGSNLTFIGEKHNYSFDHAKKLTQLLKSQKLLNLNPSNLRINMRVKEYKSSKVKLFLFSHFEKSKLNKKQIKWLNSHNFSLEQRANFGGKKSETSRPERVPTFVLSFNLQGERQKSKVYKEVEAITPIIYLEVSEHVKR